MKGRIMIDIRKVVSSEGAGRHSVRHFTLAAVASVGIGPIGIVGMAAITTRSLAVGTALLAAGRNRARSCAEGSPG